MVAAVTDQEAEVEAEAEVEVDLEVEADLEVEGMVDLEVEAEVEGVVDMEVEVEAEVEGVVDMEVEVAVEVDRVEAIGTGGRTMSGNQWNGITLRIATVKTGGTIFGAHTIGTIGMIRGILGTSGGRMG